MNNALLQLAFTTALESITYHSKLHALEHSIGGITLTYLPPAAV